MTAKSNDGKEREAALNECNESYRFNAKQIEIKTARKQPNKFIFIFSRSLHCLPSKLFTIGVRGSLDMHHIEWNWLTVCSPVFFSHSAVHHLLSFGLYIFDCFPFLSVFMFECRIGGAARAFKFQTNWRHMTKYQNHFTSNILAWVNCSHLRPRILYTHCITFDILLYSTNKILW